MRGSRFVLLGVAALVGLGCGDALETYRSQDLVTAQSVDVTSLAAPPSTFTTVVSTLVDGDSSGTAAESSTAISTAAGEAASVPSTAPDAAGADLDLLLANAWVLTQVIHDGASMDTAFSAAHLWYFLEDVCDDCAPLTLAGYEGCNWFTQGVTVNGDVLTFGRLGSITDRACEPGPSAVNLALRAFLGATSFRYQFDGNQLLFVTSDGRIQLRFRLWGQPFLPTGGGTIIDEGWVGDVAYRLVSYGISRLQLEQRDVSALTNRTVAVSVGVDPPDRTSEAPWGINDVIAERTEIGGRNYVFGMTPDNISRIVYQPLDGTAVDLTLYPIGPLGPPAQVFGQFVDDTSRTWHLIAHERQEDPTDASTTTTSTTTTTTTSTTTTTTTSTTTTTTYARRVGTLPASQ